MSLLIFIVDTDNHAGNYERDLVAYMSGQVGECEVGREAAAEFVKDHPDLYDGDVDGIMFDLVARVPDERGCHRPATIWPTPGWFNDGLGSCWRDEEWGEPKIEEAYRASIKKLEEQHTRTYSHLEDPPSFNASRFGGPGRFPAYHSVAMYLSKRPSDEILEMFRERAKVFLARPSRWVGQTPTANILGFRLVEERTVHEELDTWEV